MEEVRGLLDELRGALELLRTSGVRDIPPANAFLPEPKETAREFRRCRLPGPREGALGEGKLDPDVLFVAASPFARGHEEGGGAYAGQAGELLVKMIKGMKYEPKDVYLAFALKCAPPEGEGALSEEIRSRRGLLMDEIKAVNPRCVVALGGVAAEAVIGAGGVDVASLRGRTHELEGVRLIVTYAPQELIKDPGLKKDVWEDLKACMRLLGAKKA